MSPTSLLHTITILNRHLLLNDSTLNYPFRKQVHLRTPLSAFGSVLTAKQLFLCYYQDIFLLFPPFNFGSQPSTLRYGDHNLAHTQLPQLGLIVVTFRATMLPDRLSRQKLKLQVPVMHSEYSTNVCKEVTSLARPIHILSAQRCCPACCKRGLIATLVKARTLQGHFYTSTGDISQRCFTRGYLHPPH